MPHQPPRRAGLARVPIRLVILVMLAVALLAAGACDGDDPLSPRDIAGTWLSAWPRTAQVPDVPDTLVLDGRGGGRIRARVWLDPATIGAPPRELWAASPVDYAVQRDDVFFRWCLQLPDEPPPSCPDGPPRFAGRIHRDGMLWIGPTSLTSSLSALPWRRRDLPD